MSLARKLYIVGVLTIKLSIIILSLLGIFSILKQIGFISPRREASAVVEEGEGVVVADMDSRRDRVYDRRRELAGRVCQEQEQEITLHTVKMYDLVPPAPIGRREHVVMLYKYSNFLHIMNESLRCFSLQLLEIF